jgi:hypothetical protein
LHLLLIVHLGIDLGGGNVLMAKHMLHHVERCSVVKLQASVGMATGMKYNFKNSYSRTPFRYMSRYNDTLPFDNVFRRNRTGSLIGCLSYLFHHLLLLLLGGGRVTK